jgi:predicted RNase H-like HicB family nuclease
LDGQLFIPISITTHPHATTKGKQMARYIYPAVFTNEDNAYSINFPDLEGCYTCGDDLIDGCDMAQDVLALTLCRLEQQGKRIPPASDIAEVLHGENEFVTLITCDTLAYRKKRSEKSVKKTLTIPQWMDKMATNRGINFSKTLRDALAKQLADE